MHHLKLKSRSILASTSLALLAVSFPLVAWGQDRMALRMPEVFKDAAAPIKAEPLAARETAPQLDAEPGVIEVVRERYADGRVKIEREVTLDSDGNYVNHGTWQMRTPAGAVIAEGQYNLGQRVGLWTRWHSKNDTPTLNQFPFNRFKPPFMSQVNFTNGLMDGEWLIVDADERKCVQISIKMGERHGPAITWLPTGKTYRQSTFDNGVPVGDVLETDKDGALMRAASFVDGRKVVTKTNHYARDKQKKIESLYLAATTTQKSPDDFWSLKFAEYISEGEDLRHGPMNAWYENGQLQLEGFYQHDEKFGTFTYWHANGQMAATGEFKDDLPHATWVWWHPNGQKAVIGSYRNGVLIGQWRWWDESGRLAQQKLYDGTGTITTNTKEVFELGQQPEESETTVR